ncbi:MAG: hypothetical protein ACFFCE_09215 [Promethearchaeota archaeon]
MNKTVLWPYNEVISLRKEKVLKMLLSEIIFLKARLEGTKMKEEISYLKKGLDKLDFLLNRLKNNYSNISEMDFDRIILLVYNIFREIINNLQ